MRLSSLASLGCRRCGLRPPLFLGRGGPRAPRMGRGRFLRLRHRLRSPGSVMDTFKGEMMRRPFPFEAPRARADATPRERTRTTLHPSVLRHSRSKNSIGAESTFASPPFLALRLCASAPRVPGWATARLAPVSMDTSSARVADIAHATHVQPRCLQECISLGSARMVTPCGCPRHDDQGRRDVTQRAGKP
jgi:hypothetical protein